MVRYATGWLLAVVVGACTYEIDFDLCTDDDHCDDGEVCAVNNSCVACEGTSCPPSERCQTDDDCDEEEICADDKVCRTRCVVDAQCTSGSCYEPVCEASFGEPCLEGEYGQDLTPCQGSCITANNQLEETAPYCSHSCPSSPCPAGYECVSDYCRVVEGELVCQHPDPSKPCGRCLWDNCGYDLLDCCDGQICQDALDQVIICDESRTQTACEPLSNPFTFAPASRELLDCLGLFCDSGECF